MTNNDTSDMIMVMKMGRIMTEAGRNKTDGSEVLSRTAMEDKMRWSKISDGRNDSMEKRKGSQKGSRLLKLQKEQLERMDKVESIDRPGR